MRSHRLILTLLLSLSLSSQGCLSPSKTEAELGRAEAEKVARSMGIVDDPALTAYVQAIGERLAVHASLSDVPYRFQVVDMPEPNAFALPGGYVYVSRGLLALVNSEDELAGVIGHEIGHISSHHSLKRIGVASPFAIATGLAGFATGIVSQRLSRAVTDASEAISGGLIVAPFSRQQERQADVIGVELAAKAGWDPAALGHFLDTLAQDEALTAGEKQRKRHFLATHPSTPERVEDTARHAQGVTRASAPPIAAGRADLLARLDGLVIGADPVGGVFVEERFLQPHLDFSLAFPSGWETADTREGVYAVAPDKKLLIGVEIAGRGEDPWQPLREAERELGRAVPASELRVGDIKAVRTRSQVDTQKGPRIVDITWLAYRGLVYQISGVGSPELAVLQAGIMEKVVMSFRPLRADERAKIRESRLRIARAHSRESLEELVSRYGSDWKTAKVAVANALELGVALDPNQLVKLSIPQPYTPREK